MRRFRNIWAFPLAQLHCAQAFHFSPMSTDATRIELTPDSTEEHVTGTTQRPITKHAGPSTSTYGTQHLAPPMHLPVRASATPGTTFLPGAFVFWVHNDEKVADAEIGFSPANFFAAHTDGTFFYC